MLGSYAQVLAETTRRMSTSRVESKMHSFPNNDFGWRSN